MFEFKMPKMGESITEATIINWLKNVGDYIEAEETLVEIATDKVDNDVPSPVSGIIKEIYFQKDDIDHKPTQSCSVRLENPVIWHIRYS